MFNDIIEKCLTTHGNLKTDNPIAYMQPLKDLPFDDYTGTNKATEAKIVSEIKNALRATLDLAEDVF